jgi:hypothetical protein
MKHDKFKRFDLESELRASRSQPRADFARELGNEVRSSRERERSPLGRVGLALALSGLIVVALASFGGIGYASSAASHAVKKPTAAKHAWIVQRPKSAAAAQYTTPVTKAFTPPKAKVVAKVKKVKAPKAAAAAVKVQTAAPKATSAQLPFTGLALWVPLAVGLVLISLGLVLRTRGRRRHTGAH